MTVKNVVQRIRCVLVRTSHPGNIGAAARAMRTMGLQRMELVAPHSFPHSEATALAAGADAVLENARLSDDLATAIEDCQFVIGATARRRGVQLPEFDPRGAAAQVLDIARKGGEVALVFGNERTGLSNDELQLCHATVMIPSDPEFSSLNLAQAVQVIAYEVRLAALGMDGPDGAAPLPVNGDLAATSEQMERFFEHLGEALDDIDFHKGRSPRTIMRRLRRLFLRASLDQRELRILRGILGEAQRMSRIARGEPK